MDNAFSKEDYSIIKASALFDSQWYINTYLANEIDKNTDPIIHFMTKGWKDNCNPSPLFITESYLDLYPDIKKAGVNPLVHYIKKGVAEKRQPGYSEEHYKIVKKTSFFNKNWYLKHYSNEISKTHLDPALHYLVYGYKKGFNPSKKFDTNFYLMSYDDVRQSKICPLVHYLKSGKKEGRKISKVKVVGTEPKTSSSFLSLINRKFYQFIYRKDIYENASAKIAVHIHLFYEDIWYELKYYLANLSCYKYDLYITYTKQLSNAVLTDINMFKEGTCVIKVNNQGFDLGPFIYVLRKYKLYEYDIVFKLHSKRNVVPSNYYGVYMKGDEWRYLSYEGILSVRNVHVTINKLLKSKNIGMVSYCKFITSNDSIFNKEETIKVMGEYGFEVPQDYKYVIGTMFAAKGKVFENLINKISFYNFDRSVRGVFTIAHSFERILCLNALAQGYDISGNYVLWLSSIIRKIQGKLHPFSPAFFLDARMVKDYYFYSKHNTKEHKTISVSSALKNKNLSLYNSLIKKSNIDLTKDEPVCDSSFSYQCLIRDLIIDRKLAEIKSPVENTIFKLVGNEITVEKHSFQKKLSFLKVCSTPPVFIIHGRYLIDDILPLINGKDWDGLVAYLKNYIESVFKNFPTYDSNKLKPCAWDAIPRNALIDSYGNYRYFDNNIKYLPGVSKSYYLYRVALDVYICSRENFCPMTMKDFECVYERLCSTLRISGNFISSGKLEREVQSYLFGRVFKLRILKDFFEFLFFHSRLPIIFYKKPSRFKVITENYNFVKNSKLFDPYWYSKEYKIPNDVDPIYHFASIGWKKGYNPSQCFDVSKYLTAYPDVADAGVNPLVHWEKHGSKEAGRVCFDTYTKQKIFWPKGYVADDKAKHVLLVSHVLNHTGAPILLLQVAKMYKNFGIHALIMAPREGDLVDDIVNSGIPVIIDDKCLVPDAVIDLPCKFDLCICNTYIVWASYVTFTKITKTIWWIHDNILPNQVHNKLREVFKDAKNVFVPCELTKGYLSRYCGDVGILSYPVEDKVNEIVKRKDSLICFAVYATLQSRKGQDIFVNAISLLPSHVREQCVFKIVGDEVQNDFMKNYLDPIVSKFKEIQYIGSIHSLEEYHKSLDEIDVLCCPSREDPYPLVVIDALMHGRPAIVSDHVGSKDIIIDMYNGACFKSENSYELSLIISSFVENKGKLETLSRNARNSFISNFNYDTCAQRFINLLG